MRILYLTPGCFDKGGISRYNRYQISALRELLDSSNVKVCSLLNRQAGDFEDPFDVEFISNGIGLPSKIKFVAYVLKMVLLWRPDFIWVGHVNLSGLARVLSRLCNGKVILNTYGLEVWSGLSRDAGYGLRKADTVISDCHFTARYLEENGFRPANSVIVIWDCVNTDRFFPEDKIDQDVLERYGIPDPKRYRLIVSLGRISKSAAHKGYDRLIKAFHAIHQNYSDARLVLAGKGDWVEGLRKIAQDLNVHDKVFFTGPVDEKHLAALYRLAYVFSLASDRGIGRGEGIPLTPLEAMACGAPIIVGNHDGSSEAILDEQNGFVIDPLDIQLHARRLTQFLKDPVMRNEKGKKAVEMVNRFFSYEGFKSKHEQLLKVIAVE
ncbi:hypothetical protein WSM22_43540 [Cytophagales bacterium WSM2-2]|nr:hypothetical protein WSM22_43540 [Cytophagales bacterium WSM2-2]